MSRPFQQLSVPSRLFSISSMVPNPPQHSVPAHLPEAVERKFLEAENSFVSKQFTAATFLYRTAMERALRHLFPDRKGMLNQRIRDAEKAQNFPKAMVDWLDEVKAFGNDAAHDDWDPTEEDAVAAREFANLFATYAFTLPKRVEDARSRRDLRDIQDIP